MTSKRVLFPYRQYLKQSCSDFRLSIPRVRMLWNIHSMGMVWKQLAVRCSISCPFFPSPWTVAAYRTGNPMQKRACEPAVGQEDLEHGLFSGIPVPWESVLGLLKVWVGIAAPWSFSWPCAGCTQNTRWGHGSLQQRRPFITKASLLAGVCFPLGMYWGQSFWSRSDLSHRNVPFKWFNHLILTPPPPPPPSAGSTPGGSMVQWVVLNYCFLGLCVACSSFIFRFNVFLKKSLHIFFRPGTVDHLLNVELRHNVDGVPKTTFYSTLTGKTTSWISLILFPALLYSHLFNVELRHNVAGVPKTSLYSTLTGKTTSWISLILFPALLYSHLFNVELRHNVAGVPKTSLYSTLTGKTTSWISLILFPALLYCDPLNVELRHNVDGVPRQLCHLRCRENHVLDLSNTIPCLAILSPLGCWA